MTALTRATAAAVGVEAAYGSVAAPAVAWPFRSLSAADVVAQLPDAGWRSIPVEQVGLVPSGLASAVSVGGNLYADSAGVPLSGVLGDVQFAVGAPNTWTFALRCDGGQPPSHTLTVADAVGTLAWPGLRWRTVEVAYDPAGLLSLSAAADGLTAVPGSGTLPGTAETPLTGWTGALTVGGLTDGTLLSARVRIDRAVLAKNNTNGSLAPYLQRGGVVRVSGQLQWLCLSDTYRQDAVNGTALALQLAFTQGSGSALRALTLQMSRVKLTTAARDYSGKYVRLASDFVAVPNTADAGATGGRSPVKVTLRNTLPSGSY